MASLDEASYCPICKTKGRASGKKKVMGGDTIHQFTCENERCRWNGTNWIVQQKPDGTIPERLTGPGAPKDYEPLTNSEKMVAKAYLDRLKEEEERTIGRTSDKRVR